MISTSEHAILGATDSRGDMLDNTVESTLVPPTLKGGRYIITGILGKGGNAGVYQAWDTRLRQWRAIKVLAAQFIEDEEVRARFAQEAATMAELDHPNLVRVFDISDDPFTPHIVMEICAAGTIIDWMKVHGAVPPRLALKVIRATAIATEVAHERNIVHRDIKPQNILITHAGAIKLTDFGIAQHHDHTLTKSGATMGTYAFMAPEQRHDSSSVDHRADIYSLGATLFTLVKVQTTTELFVVEKEDEILDGIPEPVVNTILRACSYKPRQRYQSIPDLLEAIDIALTQLEEDPSHPPLNSLAIDLSGEPPEYLQSYAGLKDLLKSIDLSRSSPAAMLLDDTTLNNGEKQDVLPYFMDSPSVQDSEAPRPSYLDEAELPPEPTTATPAPAPTPTVPPDPTTKRVTGALLVAASAVALLVLFFGTTILYGTHEVTTRFGQARHAENQVIEAIEASSPVIPLTGSADALSPLYFQVVDNSPHRHQAILNYADSLLPFESSEQMEGDAKLLIQNVERLRRVYEKTWSEWKSTSSSFPGFIAVFLGLATAPEE